MFQAPLKRTMRRRATGSRADGWDTVGASGGRPTPYIGLTQYFDARQNVGHPAGARKLRGVTDTRVSDLEDALLRVAELSRDRPAVLKVICGVLYDDPA